MTETRPKPAAEACGDTLYVTDLDGTLLGTDSRVSARSAAILSELCAAGTGITAATARTPATVQPLLAGCGLRLPVVVMTGAATWDMQSQHFVSYDLLRPDVAADIRQTCTGCGLNPFVYTLSADAKVIHTWHNGRDMSRRDTEFARERSGLALKRMHIGHPEATTIAERVILFFAMGPRETVDRCADLLRRLDCSVSAYPDIFNHSLGQLEVFAPGVSKATAVARLRKAVGAKRLVVFGDNLNDLDMMAEADLSVAVANAVEPVRAAADIVIGPNSDDAVARFILDDVHRRT